MYVRKNKLSVEVLYVFVSVCMSLMKYYTIHPIIIKLGSYVSFITEGLKRDFTHF